jgi:hypothetical protein
VPTGKRSATVSRDPGRGPGATADAPAPALSVRLELHDLRLDALADGEHLGRMGRAAVAELAHVDQPVDAAQIDERTEVTEGRHRPSDHGADAQPGPHRGGQHVGLLLEELTARDDDVPPAGSSFVTRKRSRCPTYDAPSTRRRSICDPGQNARTPAICTS